MTVSAVAWAIVDGLTYFVPRAIGKIAVRAVMVGGVAAAMWPVAIPVLLFIGCAQAWRWANE